MRTRIYLLLLLCISTTFLLAQNTTIKPDKACINCPTDEPDASAVLDIQSTDKGILIPRMNITQRTGILNLTDGLLVYDTDTKSFWYYNDTQWTELTLNTDEQSLSEVLTEGNDANNNTISNLANPINNQDAATKAYVDANDNPPQDLSLNTDTLSLTDDATTVDLSGFINNWITNDGRDATFGYRNLATGDSSTTVGYNNIADTTFSSAVGYNNMATRLRSSAFGYFNEATGDFSSAFGYLNEATGAFSSAFGYANDATGINSSAFGYLNNATGANSSAFGYRTLSNVYGLMAVGRYNTTPVGSATTWVDTDPVFVIGNGEDNSNRSTALTILKNGDVGIGTTSPDQELHILKGSAGNIDANANAIGVFESDGVGYLQLLTPDASASGLLFGNTTSTAAGGIIYNDDLGSTPVANGLQFRTNGNSTRMVIDGDGDVGIGISNPTKQLHILAGEQDGINLQRITGTDFQQIRWSDETNALKAAISYDHADGDITILNAGADRMVIASNGDVGIGTTSPDSRLSLADFGPNDGLKMLGFGEGGASDFWFESGFAPAGASNFMSLNTSNGANAMSWTRGGNVGIGITNPTTKLQISGGTDVSLSSSGGYMTVGSNTDARRLAFDTDEIQAITSSNGPAAMSINRAGGSVFINSGSDGGVLSVGPASGLDGNLKVVGNSTRGLFSIAPNATSGNSEILLAGDKNGTDAMRIVYDSSDDQLDILGKNGPLTTGLATFSTLGFFVGNSIDIAGDGILDDRQGPKFGSVSNVDYNTSQTQFGILLEHKNDDSNETGGIYADGDYVVVFSAGDLNRLLRIFDEDNNTEKFYVDGNGNDFEGSDSRRKENVEIITDALDKVLKMRGVEYDWKMSENEAKKKEHKRHRTVGVIAQEVEKIVPNLVRTNEQGYKFVDYGGIAPVLIEAIKEQQVQIEAKDDLIQAQNEKIDNLENRLAKIEALLSEGVEGISNTTSTITSASLQQNAPNPFSEATNINYFIPAGTKSASLQVMDQNGRIIKSIPIQDTGNGQITLQANLLSAGTYSYSLVLDGQVMDTKQMVLTK